MSVFEPVPSPGCATANYIVYFLDETGKIRGAEWIAAAGDADALAQAGRLGRSAQYELWQRDRRIGRVCGSVSPS